MVLAEILNLPNNTSEVMATRMGVSGDPDEFKVAWFGLTFGVHFTLPSTNFVLGRWLGGRICSIRSTLRPGAVVQQEKSWSEMP